MLETIRRGRRRRGASDVQQRAGKKEGGRMGGRQGGREGMKERE